MAILCQNSMWYRQIWWFTGSWSSWEAIRGYTSFLDRHVATQKIIDFSKILLYEKRKNMERHQHLLKFIRFYKFMLFLSTCEDYFTLEGTYNIIQYTIHIVQYMVIHFHGTSWCFSSHLSPQDELTKLRSKETEAKHSYEMVSQSMQDICGDRG